MEYLKLGQEKTNSSPEPLNYSTRTRDKNLSYSNESEWRIVLEISDFKNSKDDKFYSLEHFVKYICLCVERRITEEYCKLIGDISKGL
jgi:hypothetical protein